MDFASRSSTTKALPGFVLVNFKGDMMGLAWTEHLSVGNAIIDSDHKKIIAMVNGAEYMIKKKDSFALSEAFEQIEHWLRVHFANEEMIAQAVKFPFAKNHLEHEYVLKAICRIREAIAGWNGVWDEGAAKQYAEFLSDWLAHHVIMEDMLMKSVLQNYPYDFKPE